ncbi:hypothetical protein [Mesomycoplasma ovipneumoniae]|nr:hypothetical protein [Mesomycoplasma ovipneumoniae]
MINLISANHFSPKFSELKSPLIRSSAQIRVNFFSFGAGFPCLL